MNPVSSSSDAVDVAKSGTFINPVSSSEEKSPLPKEFSLFINEVSSSTTLLPFKNSFFFFSLPFHFCTGSLFVFLSSTIVEILGARMFFLIKSVSASESFRLNIRLFFSCFVSGLFSFPLFSSLFLLFSRSDNSDDSSSLAFLKSALVTSPYISSSYPYSSPVLF